MMFIFDNTKEEERHYQNKLPILNYLLEKERHNSLLYSFRADPPTVTMQRIKGLTTGISLHF
jgi:phosphatidylinositol glycan class O